MKLYQVGGSVRDSIMGIKSHDVDYAVEVESFELMEQTLILQGFKIFLSTPKYFTVRAMFPKNHIFSGPADFTMCRKDGNYTNGRHPDKVEPGTLLDDLQRREFRMNAISLNEDGEYFDPFNGIEDIHNRIIRCVGSATDRLREDALRGLRALRFEVTKGFEMDDEIADVLLADWYPPLLSSVSKERQREEMEKMFMYNTNHAFERLACFPKVRETVFSEGLRLTATMKP